MAQDVLKTYTAQGEKMPYVYETIAKALSNNRII